ncbi:hypothetical protein [Streptococcus sp. oral taxon 061]|uniref:hypothetical protein n=1 Tax=Streptococcus sp. oral taxon 061 TaxID=712623 RepID=UPI0034D4E248
MNNCYQDMDVLEFARKISRLSIDTPLANKYDEEYGQRSDRWWSCQREHLTVWALHYPTKEKDNFTHEPSNSSKKMYNHFGRPETLLWLAEALGVDSKIIEEVIGEISNHNNASTRCKIIREYIPFERILELLD